MGSIIKELPELVANNIITASTAKDIENYYALKKEPQGNALLTIFGSLGAILVGLGIILIFAHNWDTFSQTTKTLLALLPLFVFQGLTAYSIVKEKSSLWKDASGILLFFAIGSSMALVAQIYNIPGDVSSFLFSWILLGMPLVYILRSNSLAFLQIILATYYAVEAGYFNPERPWPYLFFIAALLPFYIKQIKATPESNGVSIYNWLLPLSGIISLGAFLKGGNEWSLSILIYIAFACLLYNIGMLPYFRERKTRRNGYLCLGLVTIVSLLLTTSFRWFWVEIVYRESPAPVLVGWGILIALGLGVAYFTKRGKYGINPFQAVTFIFPAIFLVGMADTFIPVILINVLVLALGVGCIKQGIDKIDFKVLNFGMVMISMLIICRFFDTSGSFVIKGLLFVAVGAGFFATNYILIKKKKNNPVNSATHEN